MRQTLFRLSLRSHACRNPRRATTTRSPACKIRGRRPAHLRACTRPLALRWETLRRRGSRRIKLYAIARSIKIRVACAPTLLLPASAAVRVRIRPPETPLRAPIHSPTPAAAPQIPRGRKTKSRWYPRPRRKRGPRRCAANLLRSAGSRVSLFPCAPPLRPFPQGRERDESQLRFRNGKTVRHEISESSALPDRKSVV